jgi:hypothetical protein
MTVSASHILALVIGFAAPFALSAAVFTEFQTPVATAETEIVTHSPSGLRIVPASCESSPNYYHFSPPASSDLQGYTIPSDGRSYGTYRLGYTFCIFNNRGATYFVPAKTASELVNFWSGSDHPYTTHTP